MGRLLTVNNQYFTDAGAPLSGGKLYFYETGGLVAKDTYSDSALTTPNANPVVLDANGRQGDIYYEGPARVIVKTSADVTIDDLDPVYGRDSGSDTDPFVTWSATTTYAADDIVIGSNGHLYRSIAGSNTNNDPTATSSWTRFSPIYEYDSTRTYKTDEIVIVSNTLYRSKVDSNLGNAPASSPTQWDSVGNLNLAGQEMLLDADGDTSITADTDDEIDIKIGGFDDFKILANIFRALSGSQIQADTINETTAAAGVTIDGVLVKDSQVSTDQINEQTPAAGVTVDGVVLKDSDVNATVGASTPKAGTFTTLNANTNLTLASGATVTAINDEDTMSSNSDTALATQQSIKAYADSVSAGLKFISAATASASSSIDFTGLTGYDEYIIRFQNVKGAGDGYTLQLRTSTDNGSTYDSGASDYETIEDEIINLTSTISQTSAAVINISSDIGTATNEEGASGEIRIFRPAAAEYTHIMAECGYIDSTNGKPAMNRIFAQRKSSADVDAVRLFSLGGNLASGEFAIYGLRRS